MVPAMNNNNAHFQFLFKILYGICLCLAAMALNTQIRLYAQHNNTGSSPATQTSNPNDLKRIALTFDDGPHPRYTEELLDGLKERGVHVTFFVTGEHAELHPDIIKRMYEEGHLIGNHTYSHIQLSATLREQFKNELIKTNEIIQSITGEEVLYVRPPYGSWDKKLESELNMFPVLWNIDPMDWCTNNASCVSQAVINSVRDNDIILMHDYYKTSVKAALMIVDALTEKGYTFVTVDQLLFD